MGLERLKAFHNPLHERDSLFMQDVGIGLGMSNASAVDSSSHSTWQQGIEHNSSQYIRRSNPPLAARANLKVLQDGVE